MPRNRQTRTYAVDIPSRVFATVDNALDVGMILAEHDFGNFARSAVLWDQLMGEDRILATVNKRTAALTNLPLVVKPSSHSAKAKAKRVAAELAGDDEQDGLFYKYIPDAVSREIRAWGLGVGVAPYQKIFDDRKKKIDGEPAGVRLKWWHPQWVRWDYNYRGFIITTASGQVQLPREGETHPEWGVWCPYGQQYGWRRALIRAIAFRFLQRKWNDRDWSRYDEKHGIPIIVGEYPAAEQTKPDVAEFIAQLANLGNEGVVPLPMGDGDKAKYNVRMVEAMGRSFETFQLHRAEINQDVAILLLGENDTTGGSADSGGTGSMAKAKVAIGVSQAKAKEDAAFGPHLTENVFAQWADYNWGDPGLAPNVTWQVEEPEDDKVRAETLKAIGDGVTALKAAFGDRIDEDKIAEGFNVPLRKSKEQYDAENPAPVPGDPNDPNADPAAGGDGEGNEPAPDDKAPPEKKERPEQLTALGVVARREFQGLPIAIENPANTLRLWYDQEENRGGFTRMLFDYGFIEGHLSGDGEELDCYLGPDEGAPDVHIVHQLKAPAFKSWDEDKTMLGFSDAAAAKAAFLAHRDDGDRCFGGMTTIPLAIFKAKLSRRSSTRKITASAVDRKKLLYPERVGQKGALLGARALAPFKRAIVDAVQGARSREDFEARLEKTFRLEGDPKALAKIVEHVRLMGLMGGRFTAHREVTT